MPNTERNSKIRELRAAIAKLDAKIRAHCQAAPSKPSVAAAVEPVEAAAVRQVESMLDRALDAQAAGTGAQGTVEAAEKALADSRALAAKALAEHALAVELAQRRAAAHERVLRTLEDERGERGKELALLDLEIKKERWQLASLEMRRGTEQQALRIARGVAAADAVATLLRRIYPNTPVMSLPTVLADPVMHFPVAVGTDAYSDCTGGQCRLVLNSLVPIGPGDIRVDIATAAAQLAAELEEELKS